MYIYACRTLPWFCSWESPDRYKGLSLEDHASLDSKQLSSHWQGQNGSPLHWAPASQSPLSCASHHLPLSAPSQGFSHLLTFFHKGEKAPRELHTYQFGGGHHMGVVGKAMGSPTTADLAVDITQTQRTKKPSHAVSEASLCSV